MKNLVPYGHGGSTPVNLRDQVDVGEIEDLFHPAFLGQALLSAMEKFRFTAPGKQEWMQVSGRSAGSSLVCFGEGSHCHVSPSPAHIPSDLGLDNGQAGSHWSVIQTHVVIPTSK